MSITKSCPSDETLARFADGSLSPAELNGLERHLDVCEHCRNLLHAVRGDADFAQPPQSSGWLAEEVVGHIAPGTLVGGRYRVIRLVGRGGMGEVYEAHDILLRSSVGLKSLTVSEMDREETQRRLRREVLIARRITHPNVCRIFDFGMSDELCFLTMEFLPGMTLRRLIAEWGPMRPSEARPYVYQMLSGLQAAHDAGVIHRDFKSDNLLLVASQTGPQRAVVSDFGLAKPIAPGTVISTLGGKFAGTLSHAAPEQLRGETVTAAADMFAVGVVLFEMVTGGRLPNRGSTPLEMVQSRLNEPAPSPRLYCPDIDPKWEAAINRCLQLEPTERPQKPEGLFWQLYKD